IETKARSLQVARDLETKIHSTRPIRIHWSGCPAGCGNHTVADIGLLGVKAKVDGKVVDAVDVFVGGSSGPNANQGLKLLENVPSDTLPQVLQGLIKHGDPEKLRRQIRALTPAASVPAAAAITPASAADVRPVIPIGALAEGTGKTVIVDGIQVAVFNSGGQLCAIENVCPHAGASLAEGVLDGAEVLCPLHNFRFNIHTGACSTDPILRVRTFTVVPHAGGFTVSA